MDMLTIVSYNFVHNDCLNKEANNNNNVSFAQKWHSLSMADVTEDQINF